MTSPSITTINGPENFSATKKFHPDKPAMGNRNSNSRRRVPAGTLTLATATSGAALLILLLRPREPQFDLVSVHLAGFHLRFDGPSLVPLLDVHLSLAVHASNPNAVPVRYSAATMALVYRGHLLGRARVPAGEQRRYSCRILHLPARLDGMEIAHRMSELLSDAAKREMEITAKVRIEGAAKVGWLWERSFAVEVESEVKVDPVLLDVLQQESRAQLHLHAV